MSKQNTLQLIHDEINKNIEFSVGLIATLGDKDLLYGIINGIAIQEEVNLDWELILFSECEDSEENDEHLSILKIFVKYLVDVNCKRIIYKKVHKMKLGQNIKQMISVCHRSSRFYIYQDLLYFPSKYNFRNHILHFSNKNCKLSAESLCCVLDLRNMKKMLYIKDKKHAGLNIAVDLTTLKKYEDKIENISDKYKLNKYFYGKIKSHDTYDNISIDNYVKYGFMIDNYRDVDLNINYSNPKSPLHNFMNIGIKENINTNMNDYDITLFIDQNILRYFVTNAN